MAQRSTTAEKPAPKRHRGRMGCFVIIGVVMLVVVGTVFAPDFTRQADPPVASATSSATMLPSPTLRIASTRDVLPFASVTITAGLSSAELREKTPAVSQTMLAATETEASSSPSATLEREVATQIATSSPTHTATPAPTLTRTSPPTLTPTMGLILATNTHPPLVIATNTPPTSGE